MRFGTDDGRFGVLMSPSGDSYDARFFTFQLLIDGVLIGDTEPSIVFSAVEGFQRLAEVADPRLAPDSADASSILDVVLADEPLHARLLRSWTESLDRWCVLAYIFKDEAVWIAQAYDDDGRLTGPVLSTRVTVSAYTEVVNQIASYWRQQSASSK